MKQRHIVTDVNGTVMDDNGYPVMTEESIARAKQEQMAERAEVQRQTGVTITDDGILHPPRKARVYIVWCQRLGCRHAASACNEGRAIHSLSAHLVSVHFPERLR